MDYHSGPSLFQACGTSYYVSSEVVLRSVERTLNGDPSQTMLMHDADGHWHGGGRAIDSTDSPIEYNYLFRVFQYNVLFLDAHTESVSMAGLRMYPPSFPQPVTPRRVP